MKKEQILPDSQKRSQGPVEHKADALQLKRQTVRELSGVELRSVAAGAHCSGCSGGKTK